MSESLLHDIHADLFLALASLVNDVARGARPTRRELLRRLPHPDPAQSQEELALLESLFLFDAEGRALPFVRQPVCLTPTRGEQKYLKMMLSDRAAQFLLPEDLRQKLLSRLEDIDIPDIAAHWSLTQDHGDDIAALQPRLALVFAALRDRRMLICHNVDRRGRSHVSRVAPCRLEYDAAQNRCRLVGWLASEQRAIKMNLSRLTDVQMTGEAIPADTEEAFAAFLAARRQVLEFTLTPHYNAVLRCFTLFAPYDKEAAYDEDSDLYMMRVFYYDFDTTEIEQQILSLGSAVTVTAPADLRARIHDCLRQQYERFVSAD